MSKSPRVSLRKGARAAQREHTERLEKMERRLRICQQHPDDGQTVTKVVELCLADVSVLRSWFRAEYENLTSAQMGDDPSVLERIERLEAQLARLQQPTLLRREG